MRDLVAVTESDVVVILKILIGLMLTAYSLYCIGYCIGVSFSYIALDNIIGFIVAG